MDTTQTKLYNAKQGTLFALRLERTCSRRTSHNTKPPCVQISCYAREMRVRRYASSLTHNTHYGTAPLRTGFDTPHDVSVDSISPTPIGLYVRNVLSHGRHRTLCLLIWPNKQHDSLSVITQRVTHNKKCLFVAENWSFLQ